MPQHISIILPTHNRAHLLADCLVSLCSQNLDPQVYEICVVNNASTDATAEVFASVLQNYPRHNLFIVDEPRPGVSNARNTGIRSVQADLIAFADDDATFPTDWLARFIARFRELQEQGVPLGKIGGQIDPVWPVPSPEWMRDSMLVLLAATTGLGETAKFVNHALIEFNCCYYRRALEESGGFPSHLGRTGKGLLSNGAVLDCVMYAKGYKLFYDPAIRTKHLIHADRLMPQWLRQRFFWQGVCEYAGIAYLRKQHGITAQASTTLVMPTELKDWAFVNNPMMTDDLEENLFKLRALGFALATAGLIQLD